MLIMSDETEDLGIFEQHKAEARAHYEGWTDPTKLALEMQKWQLQKEAAETVLKRVNAWLDVVRLELIPIAMEDAGITSVNIAGVGRLGLTGDLYLSVKDKAGLYNWLNDNGLGDLIQPTVNSSTLKAFIKGRIKGGADYPEDLVSVTPFTRASITRTKK
jgi:hypothetical protein